LRFDKSYYVLILHLIVILVASTKYCCNYQDEQWYTVWSRHAKLISKATGTDYGCVEVAGCSLLRGRV